MRSVISDSAPNPDRTFPKPWRIIDHGESFGIVDATGFPLAYVYFEDEIARANQMQRMNKDQAWKIASAIAKIGGAE